VCAIPIVREVVPTDVNIRVRRIRPSAVRERRSWAIGGAPRIVVTGGWSEDGIALGVRVG
jgi:hypothetical protein